MNAETLHAIVRDVRTEIQTAEIVELVHRLDTALTNQVNAPADPGPQQETSDALSELRSRLASAPSNDFSPAWRRHLKEMGIADLLGEELREDIDDIFLRNQITVAVAQGEIHAGRAPR